MAKYVFITGGVVSSLGKGITAGSVGTLLKKRGLRVSIIKMDPYLNVDAGTMNPFQHGEVFVTDDGAETDLDLGHYERFIDETLGEQNSITTGKIYSHVIDREHFRMMARNLAGLSLREAFSTENWSRPEKEVVLSYITHSE